jgi:polyphosphate kinase 2 (PPK2 family)
LPPELVDKHVWKCRYEDINSFERHLTRNGTLILKFFLNISKGEQTKQLLERIKEPDKHWKFNPNDMQERGKWREYEKAYEEAISETSTEYAPWYIIPADHRWICRAAISEILLCQLEKLDLKYPKLDEEQCAAFEKAKQELQKEKK